MPSPPAFISPVLPVREDRLLQARTHLDRLTKPRGSLGHLEQWIARYAAIKGPQRPVLQTKTVYVFAADHGVVAEGVSAYPQEVTGQMVQNFLAGGAAVNVLARHAGVSVRVVNMGIKGELAEHPALIQCPLGPGTGNLAREWAMTRTQAEASLQTGFDLARREAAARTDVLITGDMGIGNTTAAAAVLSVLGQRPPAEVTGRGTGLDTASLQHKIEIIEQALQRHQPNPRDPVAVLAQVGGFEIGAIAGLILGAASQGLPVLVDGVISGAGAVLAMKLEPGVRDYLFPAHRSAEPGSQVFLELVCLPPLLDLEMRLGEGSGALLGLGLLEAGIKLYNEMATFGDAGVADSLPTPEPDASS